MDTKDATKPDQAAEVVQQINCQPEQQAQQPIQTTPQPVNYFSIQPNDLYNRTKTPFLIYSNDVLANSSGLFNSLYFTIPYSNANMLGQELHRILEDPKCQIPSNVGVLLGPHQSTAGLNDLLMMCAQWAEICRVPFLVVNVPLNVDAKKVVMEQSINRHEQAFARIILCDNAGYDHNPRDCATTILTLAKKAAHSSSAGGGLQRPGRRGGAQGRLQRPNSTADHSSWGTPTFGRGGWQAQRGRGGFRGGRGGMTNGNSFARQRAYTNPYYF